MLRYYRILVARIWLIVGCMILGGAAAVVYVKLAPKEYQAQAVLQVQPSSPNDAVLSTLPVLHQTGNPTGDVLTAASLVTTQPVASAVVRQLHLKESPEDALAAIQASPIGQAGLVAVQATASSPKLAQQLANAFVHQTVALRTASMHSAIAASLPTLRIAARCDLAIAALRSWNLGQQLDQLEQLLRQNDPTLSSAATASLPTSPSSPKTKLTIAAGLFAGLLLGIGAAFALHALDPRLRREEQLRELFRAPILARIPRERKRRTDFRCFQGSYRLVRSRATGRCARFSQHVPAAVRERSS